MNNQATVQAYLKQTRAPFSIQIDPGWYVIECQTENFEALGEWFTENPEIRVVYVLGTRVTAVCCTKVGRSLQSLVSQLVSSATQRFSAMFDFFIFSIAPHEARAYLHYLQIQSLDDTCRDFLRSEIGDEVDILSRAECLSRTEDANTVVYNDALGYFIRLESNTPVRVQKKIRFEMGSRFDGLTVHTV